MMKRLLPVFLSSFMIALPAFAALKAGDSAPDFTAQASLAGKAFPFSLKKALAKGPVVVYFYPAAYTTGCDIEAHYFALNHDKFTAAGATVIGVSLDSIERLNEFSADPDYCAGKVPVASDPGGKIATSYDLDIKEARQGMKDSKGNEIAHGFAERRTFIVSPEGKILSTVGDLPPDQNVMKTLDLVQQLSLHNKTLAK